MRKSKKKPQQTAEKLLANGRNWSRGKEKMAQQTVENQIANGEETGQEEKKASVDSGKLDILRV